jgi:uncharacterized protein YndB with AHSA1/START domain
MKTENKTQITKDLPGKTITVVRTFDAPVEIVWKAWTDSTLLDKWWAPKPWKAKTKVMKFAEGGYWLYAMTGPDNQAVWSKEDYISIKPEKEFQGRDYFCDEDGKQNTAMPVTEWKVSFSADGNQTVVTTVMKFKTEEQLNELVRMGFEEGFTMAHGNLDELLREGKMQR